MINKHFSEDKSATASPLLSRRRLMGQVLLGGAAALVLSACGGGGGSDSSDNSRDLEAAYYRLKDGMTWDEAVAAVGWAPNYSETSWNDPGHLLSCSRGLRVGSDVWYLASASLSRPEGPQLNRNFDFK